MKLAIPTIGTKLSLTEDWKFTLFHESRNRFFIKNIGKTFVISTYGYHSRAYKTEEATLPKGTVLRVDRIYIRKGSNDFDSITFTIPSCPLKIGKKKLSGRFWAKLYDVNNIECDIDVETLPK